MSLTHEQVDELEQKLREAQNAIEAAAQMVCGVGGEDGSHIYNRLASSANDIGDVIHGCFRLRPED